MHIILSKNDDFKKFAMILGRKGFIIEFQRINPIQTISSTIKKKFSIRSN